jgi:hypothetical protein
MDKFLPILLNKSLLLVYTEAFRHFNQNIYPDIFFLTVAKHKKYGGQNILNIYELDVIPYQLKQGFTYSCNITEKLLKVALNNINLKPSIFSSDGALVCDLVINIHIHVHGYHI